MIELKTPEEIEKIRKSAKILRFALDLVKEQIKPGITTLDLTIIAEKYILSQGALPAFKGYNGFPHALCISINDELIHGIPGNTIINEGDIVKIDGGVLFDGWYSDAAFSIIVGKPNSEIDNKLVKVTENALKIAIENTVPGIRIGDLGYLIENYVESNGFTVVRDYSGHGIGKKLHEDPSVPNFGEKNRGVFLKEGMVLAIEPMVSQGNFKLFVDSNGWTVRTVDHSLTAHFEHTVAITRNGPDILTL